MCPTHKGDLKRAKRAAARALHLKRQKARIPDPHAKLAQRHLGIEASKPGNGAFGRQAQPLVTDGIHPDQIEHAADSCEQKGKPKEDGQRPPHNSRPYGPPARWRGGGACRRTTCLLRAASCQSASIRLDESPGTIISVHPMKRAGFRDNP